MRWLEERLDEEKKSNNVAAPSVSAAGGGGTAEKSDGRPSRVVEESESAKLTRLAEVMLHPPTSMVGNMQRASGLSFFP